ncbi:MAG: diaminopropionate ammonia-lyase [Bacteroidetes bacterium]|nr:diaminopropionate ammonia-lyase [Bacteroidota bacterium]MCW5895925.1 diaminopropionate ammonia-lyase [Bacteroidota bacterium]
MIFVNPSFEPDSSFEKPGRTPLEFHRKLQGYKPTPLHSLPSLASQLGVAGVYVKDESSRLGLPAFKILGASWATYRVLCDRFPDLQTDWRTVDDLRERVNSSGPIVLYSATDGNHGRAVARVAKLFGLKAYIFVPKGTAEARICAIESEGASVMIVDGTYDEAVERAERDAINAGGLLIQDNGWAGYEQIPRYVVEGYSTMLHEIDDALATMSQPQPTHVLVQIGNGSFAEAVVRHYRGSGSSTTIIGVEPDSAACALESVKAGNIVRIPGPHTLMMVGMNCDSPSLVSFPVMQKGIRCFVSISDEKAMEAMRLLAESGIVSGETGAAGMGALLEMFSDKNDEMRKKLDIDSYSRVLVISTEGATDPHSYKRIAG